MKISGWRKKMFQRNRRERFREKRKPWEKEIVKCGLLQIAELQSLECENFCRSEGHQDGQTN